MCESVEQTTSIDEMVDQTITNLNLGDDPYTAARAAIEMGLGGPFQPHDYGLMSRVLEEAGDKTGRQIDIPSPHRVLLGL